MAEQADTSLKGAFNRSVLYSIGAFLRRLTGFIMLPIYTLYLTPADYGIISLLSMAIELMGILVGLRITQAMFRYYTLAETDEQRRVLVSTIMILVILASSVGIALLALGSEFISLILFTTTEYSLEVSLFAITLMLDALLTLCFGYLRVNRRAMTFLVINIIYLIIQVSLNIYFIVILEMGVLGMIYSSIISGAIMSLALLVYVVMKVGLGFDRSVARSLVNFVMPLVLASFGGFYVVYADKYLLSIFAGLTEVGLYSVALKIAAVLTTFYEVFMLSWGVERFEVVKRDDAREIFDSVFRFVVAVALTMAGFLAIFAADIIHLITSEEFHIAANYVPLLVLASVFRVFALYHNFGIIYKEKTRYIAEASWVKAIVTTVGCFSLIPLIGVMGASITLLLASLTEFLWMYRKSIQLYDMEIRWSGTLIMAATAVAVSVGSILLLGDVSLWYRLAAFMLLMLLLFVVLPVWSSAERALMWLVVRKSLAYARIRI